MKCKKTITGSKGTELFHAKTIYKILQKSASGQILLKDESGSYQWFPTTGSEARLTREYFEEVKGE